MRNRYPGICSLCGARRAAGEGRAVKREGAPGWIVICLSEECVEGVQRLSGAAYGCSTCKHWERGLGASERDQDVWGECSLLRAREYDFVNDEVYFTKQDHSCEFVSAK